MLLVCGRGYTTLYSTLLLHQCGRVYPVGAWLCVKLFTDYEFNCCPRCVEENLNSPVLVTTKIYFAEILGVRAKNSFMCVQYWDQPLPPTHFHDSLDLINLPSKVLGAQAFDLEHRTNGNKKDDNNYCTKDDRVGLLPFHCSSYYFIIYRWWRFHRRRQFYLRYLLMRRVCWFAFVLGNIILIIPNHVVIA